MKHQRGVFLWAWGLAALGSLPALADGVVRDGVGAVPGGRGGANIAHADNGVILLDNPAGMANLDGCGLFELGLDGLITDIDYADPQNRSDASHRLTLLPELSYIKKTADGRGAYGIGIFLPAGFSASYEQTNPIMGRQDYRSFGALGKILPGVAYQVTDRLSLGATLGLALSDAELHGPLFIQTGALRGVPTLFDMQTDGAAPTWSLGLQYQLSDRTTLGVSYIDETRFKLDGKASTYIFGLAPTPVYSEFDAQSDLVWPRSLGLGIKHDISCCQRFSADVIWFDWSHAFDSVDLKLSNPSNPLVAGLVGSKVRDSFPLEWQDSISLRLGYEYLFTPCDILRFGYTYNSRNVPSDTLTPFIPAILEHAFTVGYGKRWGNWDVDAAYQFSFSPDRNVHQSEFVGGDFDSSSVNAQAHWMMMSVSYHF